MNVRSHTPRVFVVAAGLALALVTACKKDDAPSPPAVPATGIEAPVVAASEFHEATFDLVMRPAAPLTAGKPGVLEIQLVPKGGFHTNETYPYKFKAHESPGLKYGAPVTTRDAVALEATRATMKVDVVPESAGAKTASGVFSFSVCSADRCLVEKRTLETQLAVD
jgi:hypothetical protein